jgi:hypothetical protein
VKAFARLPGSGPVFVTVTVTAPAVPAGVVAVMVVLATTTTLVAPAVPNVTVAPTTKFVPVMVTVVPPAVGPLFGETLVTVGTPIYVHPFGRLPLCPLTVTVTVTEPAFPAGVVAVMVVLVTTTTLVAGVPPNVTVAPAAKFVPVIVTADPPPVGPPLSGDTLTTVGAMTYVNPLVRLPLCPLIVTVTVTVPVLPAGVVAVRVVLFATTTLVAAVPPNVTVAPATKFVPVIMTAVPPPVEPLFGETLVTVGTPT